MLTLNLLPQRTPPRRISLLSFNTKWKGYQRNSAPALTPNSPWSSTGAGPVRLQGTATPQHPTAILDYRALDVANLLICTRTVTVLRAPQTLHSELNGAVWITEATQPRVLDSRGSPHGRVSRLLCWQLCSLPETTDQEFSSPQESQACLPFILKAFDHPTRALFPPCPCRPSGLAKSVEAETFSASVVSHASGGHLVGSPAPGGPGIRPPFSVTHTPMPYLTSVMTTE